MPNRNYHFDFYECLTRSSNASAPQRTAGDIFQAMHTSQVNGSPTVKNIGGKDYELRLIEPTEFGYRGVIGRHRKNDLPHAAVIFGEEREIPLNDNENLLEKSHFHYYYDYNIVILQRNRFCIGSNTFGRFMADGGFITSLNPVIEPTDLTLLASNRVHLKTAKIAIARPRNPELFQGLEHDFNNSIISTMNGSGTAMLRLSMRGDGRSKDPEYRYLTDGLKRALREMQAVFELQKCELELEDEDTGITHPVDLVANRLYFVKSISVEGRYPSPFELWQALEESRAEKNSELVRYFGDLLNSTQLI